MTQRDAFIGRWTGLLDTDHQYNEFCESVDQALKYHEPFIEAQAQLASRNARIEKLEGLLRRSVEKHTGKGWTMNTTEELVADIRAALLEE